MNDKMRLMLLWVVVLAGACRSTNSETDSTEPKVDSIVRSPINKVENDMEYIEDTIQETNNPEAIIQSDYADIMKEVSEGKLRTDTIQFNCKNEDGGGILLRYFNGDDIRVVAYNKGIGHFSSNQHMYFKNGKLFFVLNKEESWGFAGPLDEKGNPGVKSNITEHRYYISNGVIQKHLHKEFTHRSWTNDPTSKDIKSNEIKADAGKAFKEENLVEELKEGKISC